MPYEDDREPEPSSMPFGSYSNPLNTFAGTIMDMTDNEDLYFRLESNLRGEVVNNNGVKVKIGEPLMNDKGVKDIIMIMRSFGDRASVMSFYSGNEIKVLMEMLNDTLAKNLMVNRVNYGFNNPSGRDLVVFMCNACGFAIIKRGFEGGERRFWKGSQIEQTIKMPERRGGLTGLFKKG